jgi:nucleoside-diphosphate-sugar epimerase
VAAVALITGGTGLLGQHVLQSWTSDLEPLVANRRQHDLLIPGTATALIRKIRPAVVLHLAWVASGTPDYRTSAVNSEWVDASLELREACASAGVRFIATGTGLDNAPGVDDYSVAKRRLREAVAGDVDAARISWLRPFYVVDPDRGRPELVGHALHARAAGEPVPLRTPDAAHDFVHAADVGRAVAVVVARGLAGPIDIGSGRLRTVHELVEALGVPWRAGELPAHQAPHVHIAADNSMLQAAAWVPTRTEELFHRD